MAHYGVVLIRSLFPKEEAQELIREVEDLFTVIESLLNYNLLTSNAISYLKGGHPADMIPNMRLLQNLLNQPRLIQSLQHYFNEDELVVHMESTGLRHCDPKKWQNYIPWHQDVHARRDSFVTIWTPLCRVGEEAPGLEVLPRRLSEKVLKNTTGEEVAYEGKGVPDAEVRRLFGDERFHPVMDVGDVMVFSPYNLHRTYVTESMSKARISLDVRLNPASRNPVKDHWKMEAIRFPTTEKVVRQEGRSRFNIEHLLVPVQQPPAPAPATIPATITVPQNLEQKARARIKRKLHRLVDVIPG